MTELAGKAVTVTGAGRGIGRAIAVEAARQGAKVVVNDVDLEAADRVTEEIRQEGYEAIASHASHASWAGAQSIIECCVSEFGRIDGLVNNAATHPSRDPWDETEASMRRDFDDNLFGPAFCAVLAMREMRNRRSGSIITIGSRGETGLGRLANYGASKAALTAMTYSWALDLRTSGVRVNAVWPWAETQMTAYRGRSPLLGRPPSPEANTPLVVYLLSNRSTVTGRLFSSRGSELASIERTSSWREPLSDQWDVDRIAAAIEGPLAQPGFPIDGYPSNCSAAPFLPSIVANGMRSFDS
jgi:NAD(P)-dependent dehydrogenase (short-subunit alcohol dehydrogenase family)